MPQNLIELSIKYKDCITSHMLFFFQNIFYCIAWYKIPSLHQPSTVSGAYSSLSTYVIGMTWTLE